MYLFPLKVTHQLQKLKSETLPHDEPIANCFVEFHQDHEEALKLLEEKGYSRIGGTRTSETSASQCHLEADIKSHVPIEIPQIVMIRTVDSNGKPQHVGGDSVAAELQIPDGRGVSCNVHDNHDGTYKVSYTATTPGAHHLDVRVFGTQIRNSPFHFQAQEDSAVNAQQYQPVNVDIPVALVGHPHEILVNLSREDHEDNQSEKEARVDRVQATIETQTGDSVKCLIRSTDNGYSIQHTPPTDGQLGLNITINDIPAIGNPYSITVQSASPEATGFTYGQPIANQVWSMIVAPRDYRKNPIAVPIDAINVKVTSAATKFEQDLPCKANHEGDLSFTCIPSSGSHLIKASLYNFVIFEEQINVQEHLEINLSNPPQSFKFPTALAIGSDNVVYVSDTTDSTIHCFSSDLSGESKITLETKKSSQMAVDDQGVLLLLFPQTRMVYIIDQQGNELRRWPCQQKNSRPITIAATKDGRVIIADSKTPSMHIYKTDGEMLYIKDLPEKSVVDGVNNICVDKRNNIILAHHSEADIYTYNSDGEQRLKFSSGATSYQLAVATTRDDLLVVGQLGAIRIMHFVGNNAATHVGDIPVVNGHIYTSLASTSDGCILGLEVGQKRLVKYGCQIDKQVSKQDES